MNRLRGCNRDAIKYIAICAMLLDHCAWFLMSFSSPLAQAFHTVGRITAPVMCFFLAEGYQYTRSIKKYALRLAGFAVLAQIPWIMLHKDSGEVSFNMLFTLFFGLLAIHAVATVRQPVLRFLAVAACIGATYWCDWHLYAAVWCVLFYLLRSNRKRALAAYAGVSTFYILQGFFSRLLDGQTLGAAFANRGFTLGLFLAIPLLLAYNGQKGRFKASKWVFYIFYPAHLLVIAVIVLLKQQ